MSFDCWKEVILEDCTSLIFSGGTPNTRNKDFWNGSIRWLSSGETRKTFIYDTEKKITELGVKNSSTKLAKKDDVVIASAGQGHTRGQTSLCKIDTYINQSLISLRSDKNKIDPNYLFYNIYSRYNELRQISDGHSIRGSLTTKIIKNLKIKLPPLDEQKAIANILSTLDEKIEVNNQINETLEKMAQELFKRWFVDFEFPDENGNPYQSSGGEMVNSELGMIPKGWEFSRLDSIANITMGQSPKGTSYNETGNGIIFYQGRTDFRKRYPQKRMYTTEPKRTAEKGDILMSVRAPVGDINIANEKCCIGRGLAALNSKEKSNSFLLYTLINLRNKFNVFNGEGTVFGSINQLSLKSIKVIKPSNYYMRSFEKVVSKIDEKYYFSAKESRRLVNVRDTLLPKLMSGELRVPLEETEKVTAEMKGG